MKRVLAVIMACLLCAGGALAEIEQRDATGVSASDGRLTGAVVGLGREADRMEEALYVDCPVPENFTAEQLVEITAEFTALDTAAIGSAVRATGAAWRDTAIETMNSNAAFGETKALASNLTADAAREQAINAAKAFLRDCGLGEGWVVSALRPEDEARMRAASLAESVREAAEKRTLREWYRQDINYTWVQALFTLRGLPVAPEWKNAEKNVVESCVANLYIGDAGEMREFILFYAPRELSAKPYAGDVKTPLEAIAELSAEYGCRDPEPGEDERGRATPALRNRVTDVRPAYKSDNGQTFYPAWLITVTSQTDAGESAYVVQYAIDARK